MDWDGRIILGLDHDTIIDCVVVLHTHHRIDCTIYDGKRVMLHIMCLFKHLAFSELQS